MSFVIEGTFKLTFVDWVAVAMLFYQDEIDEEGCGPVFNAASLLTPPDDLNG